MNFHAWVLRKLNDIGNTYNSLSGKSKEDFNHGDAHYVTYLNVFNNPVSSKNGIEKIEIDSKQQQVKYGDIFFTTSSETPEEVGMSSVWIYNIPNTYLNSFCFGYRLNVKYNLFFLSYVFRNIYFRKQIIKLAQGISRYNISKKKVLQLSISIPKLGEQEAIGSLFKKFDDLIALQQRKIDTLKLLKKALLQQIIPENNHIIPRIRPIHFKEPWNQDKINNIFKVTRGQVLSATLVSEVKTDIKKYPVYSSQTKNNGLLGYFDKFLFEDAITWTTDGANAGTVNFRKGKFYSTNVNGVLISKDKYANQLIAEIINRIAWKYVSKVGNPKLMNNVMSDIKICVPLNYDEQNIMSLLLQNLDDFLNLNNQKIIQIKTVKKSLLQKMFM